MPANKEELIDAMRSLADALAYVRGPDGEVIMLGDDQRVKIAWHLARTGVSGMDPDRAVIKRRVLPDRPGMLAGMVDWIPVDAQDPDPQRTQSMSATGPAIDPEAMWDAIPWHVKTNIEGTFS
ncbi:MAG: hypothetical protein M3Y83_08285 [Actinomycetota bacterium]|nr:hypothetical protein [Actinomycetota bacterium]